MFNLVSKKSLEMEEENTNFWKEEYNKKVCEKIDLEVENQDLKNENSRLKKQLEELKFFVPKIKEGKIKKVISKECSTCEYCVQSSFGSVIYGCKKNCVCKDYKEQSKSTVNSVVNNVNQIIPYYPYSLYYKPYI